MNTRLEITTTTRNSNSSVKIPVAFILLLFFVMGKSCAQTATVATCSEANGVNGTVSFSLGQVFYTSTAAGNNTLSRGIQQPYEITTTLGAEIETIALDLSVYPNPTANHLNLKVEDSTLLTYQLFNSQGILLEANGIKNFSTRIELAAYPSAAYFLVVSKEGRKVKSFKVIKSN